MPANAIARPAGDSTEISLALDFVFERAAEPFAMHQGGTRYGKDVAKTAVASPREPHAILGIGLDIAAEYQSFLQNADHFLALKTSFASRSI